MSQLIGHNSIPLLLARLAQAGLPKTYVKKYAFPGWWNHSTATDQADYAQAVSFVHQCFGIPTETLWNTNAVISLPQFEGVLFKKSTTVSASELASAQSVSIAAADVALSAMPEGEVLLPSEATHIRDAILAGGKQWVDLESLLDFIWNAGIPVLHIEEFPERKMYGLAVKRHGRPVIVLSKNHKYQSLVMFDLAHELGHILRGHLDRFDVVLDVEIRQGDDDPCEKEATESGLSVLTGNADPKYDFNGGLQDPVGWAKYRGQRDRVCPGIIAQNYGFHHHNQQLANGVCKWTERAIKPIELIRKKMMQNLNLGGIPSDDAEFLMRVSGGGTTRASSSRH